MLKNTIIITISKSNRKILKREKITQILVWLACLARYRYIYECQLINRSHIFFRKLLRQNAKMQKKESESSLGGSKINVEEIIHPPKEHIKTPKMLQTVLQVKLWTIQLSTNC